MSFTKDGVVYDASVDQVADLINRSKAYVRDLARGRVPGRRLTAIKSGGTWLFNLKKVKEEWFKEAPPSVDELVAGL